MSAIDLARSAYWRARGHYRPLPTHFTAPLAGATVLEIGGPSALFSGQGLVPVYAIATLVDNVQFEASTAWHELDPEDETYAPDGVPRGRQFFADDIDLSLIPDGSYDAVISSHVIEHFANPLRALRAWRRVLRRNGVALIVAPPTTRGPSTGYDR